MWGRVSGTRVRAALALVLLALVAASARAEERLKTEVVPTYPHLSSIESITFSPDGTHILSGGWDGSLKLWETKSGRLIREFAGHLENKLAVPVDQPVELSSKVASVAFATDGSRALSGSYDATLKLWDVRTGRLLQTFAGHRDSVSSVAFSPDDATVVSGSWDNTVKLWDPTTGKVLRTLEGHKKTVTDVKFSPTGGTVLSASKDGTLKLWDVTSGKLLSTIENQGKAFTDVAFSPDGSLVIAATKDENTVSMYSVRTNGIVSRFKGRSTWIDLIAFTRDGKQIVSVSSDGLLEAWDKETGGQTRTLKMPFVSASSVVALSPDNRFLVSGGADYVLKLWAAEPGQLVDTFAVQSKKITSVAITQDGGSIVSGGWDLTVRLWDRASGQMTRSLGGHTSSVTSVALSPDGRRVLSGSWDKSVRLWDGISGDAIRTFEGHSQFVTSVVFSRDTKSILSGSWDKTLRHWDAGTGKLIHSFLGHETAIEALAISPDGRLAASGDKDGTVILWDVSAGLSLLSMPAHAGGVACIAFSSSGDRVLTGGADAMVKVWNSRTGELLQALSGHFYTVSSVALSKDGLHILTGSWDGSLKLWDVATGQATQTFQANLAQVNAVAFSPDEASIISGASDGTIRIWNVKSGHEIAIFTGAGDQAGLSLTPEGFFNASSPKAAPLLSIVRGLDAYGVDQLWQSLYSPDLVREKLAGDPDKEVAKAAAVTNLEKVLDSGKAPRVAIVVPKLGATSEKELVEAEATIAEQDNGGIGRIEWRVNGITVGVSNSAGSVPLPASGEGQAPSSGMNVQGQQPTAEQAAAPHPDPLPAEGRGEGTRPGSGGGETITAKQTLALDPGENTIEVVAYNGRNLLASVPAETKITWNVAAGTTNAVKPKLHVLAIGIDKYIDPGHPNPKDPSKPIRFKPLNLAVKDAQTFGAAIAAAAKIKDQYASVDVTTALDAEATTDGLETKIGEIAAKLAPRDTFILFVAAHGYSTGGRFYLIPQEYKAEGTDLAASLKAHAIGQDRLQDWLTNRIKAKKALVLLDTCASGALVADYSVSRVDLPASEAAIGRLHEATGRPVLTAAAGGKLAVEGYAGPDGQKHGVFTAAVLEALAKGDTSGNGLIELSELAGYVQKRVPEISPTITLKGQLPVTQKPKLGSRGEDFAIAGRVP